jgi:hypothetical protein
LKIIVIRYREFRPPMPCPRKKFLPIPINLHHFMVVFEGSFLDGKHKNLWTRERLGMKIRKEPPRRT